jgi:small subunit ribosomal protein S9
MTEITAPAEETVPAEGTSPGGTSPGGTSPEEPAAVPPEPAPSGAAGRAEATAGSGSRPSPTAVAETAGGVTAARRRRPASGLIQTVGRRKEAIVRVRIAPGAGVIICNGRPLESYFPSKVHQQLIKDPLVLTERAESLDIHANLRGGGTSGQAGALRLAIARALIELDIDHRPALKKAGFLTRDSRMIERKKYGLKKARKAPQYSKR